MIRQLYNRLHRKFYYSTSFHRFIAPKTGDKKVRYPEFSFYGKKLLSTLLQIPSFKVINDTPGLLVLQLGSIKAEITAIEELYILNEIFVDGCYNFLLPANEIVVMDIGMNAGLASLFFAQSDKVKQIYSFEPFEPTFKQALRNIALNEDRIKNKIVPANYGIAGRSRREEWAYEYSNKGNIGLRNELETSTQSGSGKTEKISVQLNDVSGVLKDILAKHPSQKLVLKIDCEGAEYEIIQRLSDEGLLEKVSLLMIEWHLKGPDELNALLVKSGYSIVSMFPLNKVAGMIYAYNNTNS